MDIKLFLTADEKKAFESLPASVRDGWPVESETLRANERPEELLMRLRMASFASPACQKLKEVASKAQTKDEIERAAAAFEIETVPHHELLELLFTLGVKWQSAIVLALIAKAASDEDVEGCATLTTIRHALLETNQEVPTAA